jgi:hypothetical protein
VRTTRLATVIVYVHDARLRRCALRDLVRVVGGRDARPEIEELTDVGFGCQVPRGPAEESPVGAYPVAQSRRHREDPVSRYPVGGEI